MARPSSSSFLAIGDLIQKSLEAPAFRTSWRKGVVLAAWKTLFPRSKTYLKTLFIKNNVIYVHLDSLILTQDLRRKKAAVLQKLQQAIQTLGEKGEGIQDLVFL